MKPGSSESADVALAGVLDEARRREARYAELMRTLGEIYADWTKDDNT